MTHHSAKTHHLVAATRSDPSLPGEQVNDDLLMSRGTSNAYVIPGIEGDVVINTGTPFEGGRARERFEAILGRPLQVAAIVLTQSHADHAGGWGAFADPGCRTFAHRLFPIIDREHKQLKDFYNLRRDAVLHAILQAAPMSRGNFSANWKVDAQLTITDPVDADGGFAAGGRDYVLHAAPGGETTDSLFVWVPATRTVFIGNWAGALYGALPNFYTLRGDRDRSVAQFLRDLDWLIALDAAILVTGHDEPIVGAERVRADLAKLRRVIGHIHDETLRGMNAGKDMWTLMREVGVPAGDTMAPGRGPARWIVRAVWEEYAGWFRHERSSELYATPPQAIWGDLCDLAGGPDRLAAQAADTLRAGDPEAALHWIEIALWRDPANRAAREVQLAVLDALIDRNANQHFDEICWLETEVRLAREALDQQG
jgi:alkyl sulfatase BDS1-like metallo-beta-lactamase superfamily hydrolase